MASGDFDRHIRYATGDRKGSSGESRLRGPIPSSVLIMRDGGRFGRHMGDVHSYVIGRQAMP
jgi:hypothetical protein